MSYARWDLFDSLDSIKKYDMETENPFLGEETFSFSILPRSCFQLPKFAARMFMSGSDALSMLVI